MGGGRGEESKVKKKNKSKMDNRPRKFAEIASQLK